MRKVILNAAAGLVALVVVFLGVSVTMESVGFAGPTMWREHIANLVVDNMTLNSAVTSSYALTADDLSATDDVTAGDDLISTDDTTVGDDLTVTGLATIGETLTIGAGTAMNEVFFQRHAYGGGGTTTQATVTGALATDTVLATVTASTNASYVVKAVPGTDTVDLTLSADPGADSEISIIVIR